MQVVLCSEKFRISSYGSILDDPESKFWILRIILESTGLDFNHIGNLDETNGYPSSERALGLGFEMFHRCLISCVCICSDV